MFNIQKLRYPKLLRDEALLYIKKKTSVGNEFLSWTIAFLWKVQINIYEYYTFLRIYIHMIHFSWIFNKSDILLNTRNKRDILYSTVVRKATYYSKFGTKVTYYSTFGTKEIYYSTFVRKATYYSKFWTKVTYYSTFGTKVTYYWILGTKFHTCFTQHCDHSYILLNTWPSYVLLNNCNKSDILLNTWNKS